MFNTELTLIDYVINQDEIGNEIKENNEQTILCEISSVGRYEFFNYGTADLKPELIAIINACEYDDQKDARVKGKDYKITRTYQKDRDLMELTLSRIIQR